MIQKRSVIGQEYSRNQAPSDITGARHVSTVRNTTYQEREEGYKNWGQKNIDESKIVERVSTYNRNKLNEEERSFGGVHKNNIEMEYKSSRIE